MTGSILYGPGGYDPGHPNGNVVERVVDHGDGTGTRTTYDETGVVDDVDTITLLVTPMPADPPDLRSSPLRSER